MRRAFSDLRYCPFCGLERLERDNWRQEHPRAGRGGRPKARDVNRSLPPDWICTSCGMGFKVGPSPRWEAAMTLFQEQRKLRVNFKDCCERQRDGGDGNW